MTSPRIALLLAAAALALTAAPAAADPVPLLASRSAQSVEVAGNDVIVARAAARGAVHVDALPAQGGPSRPLLTLPARGRGWSTNTFLAASAQRVAAVVEFTHQKRNLVTDRRESRLYTGPASGPLTLVFTAGRKDFLPFDIDVDGDRVIVSEARGTTIESRALLLVPGAAPHVIPWPGNVDTPIALAGNHAAFVGTATRRTDEGDEQLFVVDPITGARQATIGIDGLGTQFDLAPDGHVVAAGIDGLFTAGAGQPRTLLSGGESMFFATFAGAAVAGFDLADLGTSTPAVVDPGAGQARPIGVPTLETADLEADANGVAWIAHGCVLFAPLDSVSPEEPPAGPCPRSEANVESVDNVLAGRKIHLTVMCVAAPASGCRGQVTLRLRRKVVGHKRFHAASGAQHDFTVRLSKRAARFVRKHVHHGDGVLVRMKARVSDGGPAETESILLDRVRGA
jgi:hypothetical protein